MKNFLRLTALAICAILMTANASAQDNYNATTMGEKVYLETANWDRTLHSTSRFSLLMAEVPTPRLVASPPHTPS